MIILVGNKKDLDAEREVTFMEASRFAQENGKYYVSLLVISRHSPRGVTRALIWGGGGRGVYSYIRVLPDGFLLKSIVFNFISKEIRRAEHEYMNMPPPPINALVTPLHTPLNRNEKYFQEILVVRKHQ